MHTATGIAEKEGVRGRKHRLGASKGQKGRATVPAENLCGSLSAGHTEAGERIQALTEVSQQGKALPLPIILLKTDKFFTKK